MSQTLPKLSHRLVDEAQYNLLRSVGYLSRDDRRDIIDACEFGDIAHIKDKRKSGEPYIRDKRTKQGHDPRKPSLLKRKRLQL